MRHILFSVVLAGLLIFGMGGLRLAESRADSPAPESTRLIDSLEGPALYKAYCAVCHATNARGGGPMAVSLKVPPPDLTRVAARHDGVFPMARIERIISGEEPLFRTRTWHPGHAGVGSDLFRRSPGTRDLGLLADSQPGRIHSQSADALTEIAFDVVCVVCCRWFVTKVAAYGSHTIAGR